MEYLVQWTIEVDADDPIEAARNALAIQRSAASLDAEVFQVCEEGSDEFVTIDLQDLPK